MNGLFFVRETTRSQDFLPKRPESHEKPHRIVAERARSHGGPRSFSAIAKSPYDSPSSRRNSRRASGEVGDGGRAAEKEIPLKPSRSRLRSVTSSTLIDLAVNTLRLDSGAHSFAVIEAKLEKPRLKNTDLRRNCSPYTVVVGEVAGTLNPPNTTRG